MECT